MNSGEARHWRRILKDQGMNPATLRCVVLDLDGTLAHLPVDWATLKINLARLAVTLGWKKPHIHSLSSALWELRTQLGENAWRRAHLMTAEAEVRATRHAPLRRDVLDFISSLPRVPLGVFTGNSRAAAEAVLARAGLIARVRRLVARDDQLPPKPSPEGLVVILKACEAPPHRTLFIGDSELDRIAGRGAGVPTLIVAKNEASH